MSFIFVEFDVNNNNLSFTSVEFDINNNNLSFLSVEFDANNYNLSFLSVEFDVNNYNMSFLSVEFDVNDNNLSFVSVEFDVDRIPDRVQMYQWLNMWGNLTHGAKAMMDFPVWLQILPKILFKVINRRGERFNLAYDTLSRYSNVYYLHLRQQNKCYSQRCLIVRRTTVKLQLSVKKFDRSNKFDLCYYGQVNSLRLRLSVASKWASRHFWGYHLFCCFKILCEYI